MSQPVTWTPTHNEPVEYRAAYSEIVTAQSEDPSINIQLPLPKGTYRVTVTIEKERT